MENIPHIRLFGRVSLSFGTATTERFSTTKCHELVAFLTMVRGREIGRNTICRALWPDDPASASIRNRLSVTTYLLRKECLARGVPLGKFMRSERGSLRMGEDVSSDYDLFLTASRDYRSAKTDEAKVACAHRILELYKCPLCEGIEAPWLTALRAEARQTFQDAVMSVVRTQSSTDAVETVRRAVLLDLDAEGAIGTFLRWMAGNGSWETVDEILWRLETASSARARRMAVEFRRSVASMRPAEELGWSDQPILTVCIVDEPGRAGLAQVQGKGPKREDFVLLANPLVAEQMAKEILGKEPKAKVSLHLVVMDPGGELPPYVREQHRDAMAGKLWLSTNTQGLLQKMTQEYSQVEPHEVTPSA